jgi:hypothetical protein
MDDHMGAFLRGQAKEAMNDPDRDIPFFADAPTGLLSSLALRNMATMLWQAQPRLTPRQVPDPSQTEIELVYLAACFHWARTEHLPEDESDPDHHASICLFSVIHAVRPDAVPQPRRSQFAQLPPAVAPVAEILHAVAVVLLHDFHRARDDEALRLAVAILSDAVKLTPEDETEPVILMNLGVALEQLADLTRDTRMMAAAIGKMSQAVNMLAPNRSDRAVMLGALSRAQRKASTQT